MNIIYHGNYRYTWSTGHNECIQCFGKNIDTGEDVSWTIGHSSPYNRKFQKADKLIFETTLVSSYSVIPHMRGFKDISDKYPEYKII